VTVGIDVAKAHVDVFVLGAKSDAQRLNNDAEGHSTLAAALQPLGVGLVVMEATGGYEAALACALQAAGLPVAVVNPRQAREFARATGIFREKMIGLAAVLGLCLISFSVIDNFPRLFFATPILGIGLIAIITIPQDRPAGFIQRVGLGMMGYLFFGFSLYYLAIFTADPLYRPLLLQLMLTVELNDIFAFCCGKMFGGRKILPNISPGKTIAGAVGALVLTVTLIVVVGHWVVFPGTPMDSWGNLIIMGIGISGFGQFGDLLLSAIKRDLGVKDLGSVLPGHGGVLDRVDGILFALPTGYLLLVLLA
jgi:phosphatidate cytidylyltransferase